MKKILVSVVVLTLALLLASCGGADKTTSTTERTEGVAAETTAITTKVEDVANKPIAIDYNEATGLDYTMVYVADGYFTTTYNGVGNPLKRQSIDWSTMMETDLTYVYEYDTQGKLKAFSARINSTIPKLTPASIAFDESGMKATGTFGKDALFSFVWEFDANGKMLCETILNTGKPVSEIGFDTLGRIVKESIYYGSNQFDMITTYEAGSAHTVLEMNGKNQIDVTITSDENGYPVKTIGYLDGGNGEYLYTYNEKHLCVSIDGVEESRKTQSSFDYDASDRCVKHTQITYKEGAVSEKKVAEYTYDENGRTGKLIRTYYDGNDQMTRKFEETFAYDNAGRIVSSSHKQFGADNKHESHVVYEYGYDETGRTNLYVTKHYDAENNLISEHRDQHHYDSKGNLITYTNESTENGQTNKTVTECFYDDQDKKTQETRYRFSSGNLTSKEVILFNEDGNVYSSVQYEVFEGGEQYKLRETINTYENGLHIKNETWTYQSGSDNLSSHEVYEYEYQMSAEGSYMSRHTACRYDALDKLQEKTVYEYRADGSVISRTMYDGDGNIIDQEIY